MIEDLSDLKEVMEWVRDHPKEVRKIAENGYKFYWEYLSFKANDGHWYELLWRLSELLHQPGNEKVNSAAWPSNKWPLRFERDSSNGGFVRF